MRQSFTIWVRGAREELRAPGLVALFFISALCSLALPFNRDYLFNMSGLIQNGLSVMDILTAITCTFFHQNFFHLVYNFLPLLPFLLYSEKKVGTGRFLQHYFTCGAMGCAVALICFLFWPTSEGFIREGIPFYLLGSSGCTMGMAVFGLVIWGRTGSVARVLSLVTVLTLFTWQLNEAYLSVLFNAPLSPWIHLGGMTMGALLSGFEKWK